MRPERPDPWTETAASPGGVHVLMQPVLREALDRQAARERSTPGALLQKALAVYLDLVRSPALEALLEDGYAELRADGATAPRSARAEERR